MKRSKLDSKDLNFLEKIRGNLREMGSSLNIDEFMRDLFLGKLLLNNPRNKRIRKTVKKFQF